MRLLWQRAIGAIVVTALAVLPVTAVVCAALCAAAGQARATPGHPGQPGAPSPCHESTEKQARVSGAPDHECHVHDGPAADASPFLSATRADDGLIAPTQLPGPSAPHLFGLTSVVVRTGSGSPPGTTPPARTRLVLRI